MGCRVKVSNYLEEVATLAERNKGFDLADFFISRDEKFGWALSQDGYPIFWDHGRGR
jgi:hypothetical protein